MSPNDTHATVIIVDQNRLSREGMIRLFDHSSFQVVGQSATLEEVMEEEFFDQDASLLVVNAPNRDNESYAKMAQIRTKKPNMKLVVLVDDLDRKLLAEYFGAGVDGYLLKDVSTQALIASLNLVMTGERVFSSGLIPLVVEQAVANRPSEAIGNAVDGVELSERETEILRHLAAGEANKVIANQLNVAEATVKVHIKHILKKTAVQNRTQAAIWAINNRIAA
jgi:two-component system, NarL family, nitrate/nitrite response regulator NarL